MNICKAVSVFLLTYYLWTASPVAVALELYVHDPTDHNQFLNLQNVTTPPVNNLPVLFVHGHNVLDENDAGSAGPNYKVNWVNSRNALKSFHQTIFSSLNDQLGIEPYYIRFQIQGRSIADDAAEIGQAVETILKRHDSNFNPANSSTNVKVVIIAYSKGTISSRLYLKNLFEQDPTFKPVSEFIAISPPNHGLKLALPVVPNLPSLAAQQLNNGYNGRGLTGLCLDYNNSASKDFIANLNGHDMAGTHADAVDANGEISQSFPSEAPGSRNVTQAPHLGVLYVTLYPADNADLVGGDHPPGSPNNTVDTEADCDVIGFNNPPKQGRLLAKNLAPDAKNIQITGITGSDSGDVHQNAVHDPNVICQALYTAVHHRPPPSATGVCTITNNIPQIPLPPRASAELVLDRSGSMNQPACIGCPDKIDILKDAVSLFIDLWAVVGAPTDQLGVTYFSNAATEFACNPNVNPNCRVIDVNQSTSADVGLLNLVEKANEIKTNVNNQNAAGMTAMGQGLQNGILRLQNTASSEPQEKRIILFTDGMQNVAPLVEDFPQGCDPEIDCQYRIDAIPTLSLNNALGIPVDTIGVGASDPFLGMLTGIARETNGFANVTLDPQTDLRLFFIESLINALRGFSPQLIDYRQAVMNNDEVEEKFQVNNSVNKVIFKLSWPRHHQLSFSVLKDGIPVTDIGQFKKGDTYHIFWIDLPAQVNGQPLNPQGEWTMRIRGDSATSYQAAAIVDETKLKFTTELGSQHNVVGQALPLTVYLEVEGQPVTTPTQIKATLIQPGQSLGTLLSITSMPDTTSAITVEPNTTLGQRKLQTLLLDDTFRERLQPVQKTITLTHQGNGRYTAQTPVATIPGIYKVTFNIQGEHPQTGPFIRSETRSTHVAVAAADLKTTQITVVPVSDNTNGRRVKITLIPKDSYGNYLGPDYGRAIQFDVDESNSKIDPIQDNGDGSYTVTLSIPADVDPTITVSVLGKPLVTGTLSEIESKFGADVQFPYLIWIALALFILIIIIIILRKKL
jgi:hypothetical protein